MKTFGKIQLGKNGVTENFIEDLKKRFNTHKNLKINVLRSCCRDKKEIKKIEEKILEKLNSRPCMANDKKNLLPTTKSLGKNFTARTIGYTIAVKKLRKVKDEQI